MKPINDLPRGSATEVVGGKKTTRPFYSAWKNMIKRCSEPFISKHPTYAGCTICDEWLSLSSFKIWFDANSVNGWQLDKDLLVLGNKIYSPKYCRFVPASLNSMFLGCESQRGEFPKGVYLDKALNKYRSCIYVNGKTTHLGIHETSDEAKDSYDAAKRNQVFVALPIYLEMGVSKDLIKELERRFT